MLNGGENHPTESLVDAMKLTERDNTLGGFVELTNYLLEVTGYVADAVSGQSREEEVHSHCLLGFLTLKHMYQP